MEAQCSSFHTISIWTGDTRDCHSKWFTHTHMVIRLVRSHSKTIPAARVNCACNIISSFFLPSIRLLLMDGREVIKCFFFYGVFKHNRASITSKRCAHRFNCTWTDRGGEERCVCITLCVIRARAIRKNKNEKQCIELRWLALRRACAVRDATSNQNAVLFRKWIRIQHVYNYVRLTMEKAAVS